MKNITRVYCIVSALTAVFLVACGESKPAAVAVIDCDNPNLTRLQREQGNCFWDMGGSTDRTRNRGF